MRSEFLTKLTTVGSLSSPDQELMDTTNGTSTVDSDIINSESPAQHVCTVCGDDSDGLHFGQYTCRACAAFFRRTVSLKLNYTCKHDNVCHIEKNARNMCRSCRFRKCLDKNMLISAVQHARDGIGKRRDKKIVGNFETPEAGFNESKRITTSGQQMNVITQSNASSRCSSVGSGDPVLNAANAFGLSTAQYMTQEKSGGTIRAGPIGVELANALYNRGYTDPSNHSGYITTTPSEQTTILQLGQTLGVSQDAVPYMNFANMNLHLPQASSTRSAFTPVGTNEMKILGRMLEGYHHFVSLRKASYTLIEDGPRFAKDQIPQSNYGTSKKICKIEASLLMDTVDKFYIPFSSLSQQEKNHIFDSFYCLFSNTERAYRTYKMFPENDDRLLMPDGGYVRLSELSKFYENSSFIRGDPLQVARIFENAMHYIVNVVVQHMRSIEVSEMEIIALSGMFLWRGSPEFSPETVRIVQQSRQQVILDLHAYYRNIGLFDADITVKVANLLLLVPKIEHVVRLFKENYSTAEIFNIMEDPCTHKTTRSKQE